MKHVKICVLCFLIDVLAAAPSRQSLEQLRGQVAMELLWVQQAIQSRKQVNIFINS